MATESAFVNALLARMAHATEAIAAYSIYYRMVLFAFQPVIASSVAMLPYAARLLGTGDHAGVRRGLRQIGAANAVYSLIIVGPAMFLGGPWIARRLAESPLTADYTQVALRLVPLACLVGAPFLLCRPVFEAMQQGRPGLIMALLRYIGLTAPLSWVGIQLARRAGVAELYGLMIGLLFAAALSSGLFAVWLRQALRSSERQQVTEPS
jgi:Na+-driven multidrug efflux pump